MPTEVLAQPSGSGQALVVGPAAETEARQWDAFVASRPNASYHAWGWRGVFERTFGHQCHYLVARGFDGIQGVLPLVQINSPLFGRTLTSLPFVNYGGVIAEDEETAQTLLDAATDLARSLGCRHVELRHVDRRFSALPARQHKVTMLLPLGVGMWERLDRKVRNQIRKAEKSGLAVSRGGAELLDDFYAVFSRNMRDLGTPVYSRRLFEEVLRAFPYRARLHVVRLNGAAVAAALTYRTGTNVEVPWASSVRDYNHLCPNHLLYWSVIEAAVAEGGGMLDFGRSTPDEGTYKFKEQWGAQPLALHWEYSLLHAGGVPDQSPKNPKFKAAVDLWKRCPLWLANTLGPHIVRSIP